MRTTASAILLLAALVLLSACGAAPGDLGATRSPDGASTAPATAAPAPTPPTEASPAPAPPAPPAVPRQDAGLEAQAAAPDAPAPVGVRVDDLQLDMRVLPMGVDEAGAMALPEDTADAGWYRFGPAPGEAGTTVLAAHVDSRIHGLGAFARLRDVSVGAAVVVTTADGVARGYRVQLIERTPKTEVPLDLLFDRAGAERLVLVTCGGEFDRGTGHYRDNVIVTAIPDP